MIARLVSRSKTALRSPLAWVVLVAAMVLIIRPLAVVLSLALVALRRAWGVRRRARRTALVPLGDSP